MAKYTVDDLFNELKEDPRHKKTVEVSETVCRIIGDISKARIKNNLSQKELAELCGMKQSAIARIENMHSIPRLDTLAKIAHEVGVDIHSSVRETHSVSKRLGAVEKPCVIVTTGQQCIQKTKYRWSTGAICAIIK